VTLRQKFELAVLLAIGILPFELNGLYNPGLAARPPLFWTVELFTWIVMPASIYVIARHRKLFTPRDVGLSAHVCGRRAPGIVIGLAIVLIFAFYFLDRASVRWGHGLWPDNPGHIGFTYNQVLPNPGPTTGLLRLLAVLYRGLGGGMVEELFYRGMMKCLFPSGPIGAIAFVILSSVIFASVHWEFGRVGMFEAIVFGLAAAIVYAISGNLWPLIVAHTIIDCLWLIDF
jgi:membrane protease YdiL (CAAX protease family)